MKLKLEKVLPEVIERLEGLKQHSNIIECCKKLKASCGKYNRFEVKLAWEVCRIVVTTKEVHSWYDEYGCNDGHITSLFIAACRKTGLL